MVFTLWHAFVLGLLLAEYCRGLVTCRHAVHPFYDSRRYLLLGPTAEHQGPSHFKPHFQAAPSRFFVSWSMTIPPTWGSDIARVGNIVKSRHVSHNLP